RLPTGWRRKKRLWRCCQSSSKTSVTCALEICQRCPASSDIHAGYLTTIIVSGCTACFSSSFPFCFLLQADVYKTLEDLVPLQVNVQAVANREEFFQEENYASLVHVRARLKEFIRKMNYSRRPRAKDA
ncbi:unnamed protein product, partial [Ectocarpus sp. 12 AP-2014]